MSQIFALRSGRLDGDMTQARAAGLAVLASVGYQHAQKNVLASAWSIYRDQAVGIQVDTRDLTERLAAMDEFHNSVLGEINSQVLADIARGLGLTRWDKGGKDGISKDKSRAIGRASNYQARLTRAWRAGLAIGDDWSASKANNAAVEAEEAANVAAMKGKPVPGHVALEQAGNGIAACTKLASSEDSKLEPGAMAALAGAVSDLNRIIAEAARGNVDVEAINELTHYLAEARVLLVGGDVAAEAAEETEALASMEAEVEDAAEAATEAA